MGHSSRLIERNDLTTPLHKDEADYPCNIRLICQAHTSNLAGVLECRQNSPDKGSINSGTGAAAIADAFLSIC